MKQPPKVAVCLECGHTWKPYNSATTNHKRRCSKCKSYAVEIRDPEPKPEDAAAGSPAPEPTPKEEPKKAKTETELLAEYINSKPEPKKPAENDKPAETKKTSFKPSALLLAFIVLGLGGLLGASWYFHRRRPPMVKTSPNEPQSETEPAQPKRTSKFSGL